ncbi:MAG: SoxR reducing system RseC family protein [Clostridia bacterium]|nr:SoxR reducing system RseC family protein [Clostridia bacterium]
MRQYGVVQRLNGDHVEVLVSRPTACKSCGACQLGNNAPHAVTVRNEAGADVGDTVALELSGRELMRAAGLAYGVPLLAFLAGLGLGPAAASRAGLVIGHSLASAIGGFLFLALGYYGVHLYDRSVGASSFMSVATEVVDPDNLECSAMGKCERPGGSK